MIHFLAPRESAPYVQDYIDRAKLGDQGNIIGYEDIPHLDEFAPGLYVFTAINRLGPATVAMLTELHARLEDGTGLRPLNHPTKTLRRYELLQALNREGLNEFKASGAWEDLSDLRFPVFVRPREQDGTVPELLHSHDAVRSAIGKELMDGWTLDELLVVEFKDTTDEHGVYRKYSAYIIGERVLATSMDPGREWVMRRHSVDFRKDYLEEEWRYANENPHEEQLARIFSLSGTQFGRIDYSMSGDRVQTWEINTLPLLRRPPGVTPMPDELRKTRQPTLDLVGRGYTGAFHHLLASVPSRTPFRPSLDEATFRAAREELASRGATDRRSGSERWAGLRRLVRPLKPVLKPLNSRTVLPLWARWARRGR